MILFDNGVLLVHLIAGSLYTHNLDYGSIKKIDDGVTLCLLPDTTFYRELRDESKDCLEEGAIMCNKDNCFWKGEP